MKAKFALIVVALGLLTNLLLTQFLEAKIRESNSDTVEYSARAFARLTQNGAQTLILPKKRQIKINIQELPGAGDFSCLLIDFKNLCSDGSCTISVGALSEAQTTGPNHDGVVSVSKRFIVDSFSGFHQATSVSTPLPRRLAGFTYVATNTAASVLTNQMANLGSNTIFLSGMGSQETALLDAINGNAIVRLTNFTRSAPSCQNLTGAGVTSGGLPPHVFVVMVSDALGFVWVED